MVDIKGAIQAGRGGGLEKLISQVPGYGGYAEKNLRREADRLLRQYVAGRFDEQRRLLSELQLQLISGGQLDLLDDLDQAIRKVQTLTDRIRTATYGYAGFFDAVKVQEPQLDALYAFDNALLDEAGKIAATVRALGAALASKEGVTQAIAACIAAAQDATYTFSHREEVILQGAATVAPPQAPAAPEPPAPHDA
jgi:hypothetical protein